MRHVTTLAEFPLKGKRNAARRLLGHFYGVKRKPPKTPLQQLFIKRVKEELSRRGLSENQLSQRVGAPPQKTLNDILNGTDPRLEQVWKISVALGVHPCDLLRESDRRSDKNIADFPRLPTMLADKNPVERRKKSRG